MNLRLQDRIELERKKLADLCNQKGSILHPDVLACSEHLDRLILNFLTEVQSCKRDSNE